MPTTRQALGVVLDRRSTTLLSALAAAALSACGSSTAPPLGPELFRLSIINRFEQIRYYSPNPVEADSAVFTVSALNGVTHDDLAKIQSMIVTWPDGTTTELPNTFTFKASGTTSSVALAEEAPLPAGTYTLDVALKDGQRFTKQVDVAAGGIPPTRVIVLRDERLTDGQELTLTWVTPPVDHSYRLALVQGSDTLSTSSAIQSAAGSAGDTVSQSVRYTPTSIREYDLVLLLSNDNNLRAVHTEFLH